MHFVSLLWAKDIVDSCDYIRCPKKKSCDYIYLKELQNYIVHRISVWVP